MFVRARGRGGREQNPWSDRNEILPILDIVGSIVWGSGGGISPFSIDLEHCHSGTSVPDCDQAQLQSFWC